MKISFIGPGFLKIPPSSHGAVELIIWEYKNSFEKLGWDVQIVNEINKEKTIELVNHFNPDFVHIHLDHLFFYENFLNCKKIGLTNHDGYAEFYNLRPSNYTDEIKKGTTNFKGYHLCLSDRLRNFYINHFKTQENKTFVLPNGVNINNFYFSKNCYYKSSICLGKIDDTDRKNQIYLSSLKNDIKFVGPVENVQFNHENYIGIWEKSILYKNLTKFANLILLSKGEAAPLVCIEALSAGLGLVITEKSAANLDTSLPFIEIIPEKYLYDIDYVSNVINKNIEISIKLREDIRKYAVENFCWDKLTRRYSNLLINKIL
jgi:glycosyltransferase involved in cell wall biosynthesis